MRDVIIAAFDYVVFPLLFIFALNCLTFDVPYTLETWVGAIVILFLFNVTTPPSQGQNDE